MLHTFSPDAAAEPRYIPDRRQLALPIDERPPNYRQVRRLRHREKRALLMATCPRCVYCGRQVIEKPKRVEKKKRVRVRVGALATLDHVIPESRGGLSCLGNLVLSCKLCNEVKDRRTPQEWAADILRATQGCYPVASSPKRLTLKKRLQLLASMLVVILPFTLSKGGVN